VRFVHRIQPDALIKPIPESIFSEEAFAAIKTRDVVFGSVDDDGVRLGLLELCCAHRIPYIDLATEVEADGTFGGRVIFSGIGKGCLFCKGELDSKEVWRYFASEDQRREDDRIYGVDRSALNESGPSVVSINGVVGSLAVTEFAVSTSGLRPPQSHLIYRGSMGIVTRTEPQSSGCYYCSDIWNGKAQANLRQYLAAKPSPNAA